LITAAQQGEKIELCVHDQGMPLPEALRELAFTADGQLSEALHRTRYGRGIGLYCAKVAASLCGAALQVVERPDAQNTFAIQVPLSRVA
jgi:signal transduction histidine kinase